MVGTATAVTAWATAPADTPANPLTIAACGSDDAVPGAPFVAAIEEAVFTVILFIEVASAITVSPSIPSEVWVTPARGTVVDAIAAPVAVPTCIVAPPVVTETEPGPSCPKADPWIEEEPFPFMYGAGRKVVPLLAIVPFVVNVPLAVTDAVTAEGPGPVTIPPTAPPTNGTTTPVGTETPAMPVAVSPETDGFVAVTTVTTGIPATPADTGTAVTVASDDAVPPLATTGVDASVAPTAPTI